MKPAFTNFYLFLVLFGSTIVRASIIPKVSGVNTEIVAPTNKNEELSSHFINVMKESIPNEYIVMFKKNVKSYQIQAHFKHLQVISNLHGKFFDLNTFKIEPFQIGRNTEYNQKGDSSPLLNGYLLKTDSSLVSHILPYLKLINIIEVIETNSKIHLNKQTIQEDTPWGLTRISKRDRVWIGEDQKYLYDMESLNPKVVVNSYILDTGINIEHEQFEGRASWGITIPDNDNEFDYNGHGTHCAGVIGSRDFGVAKNTRLIAVKVLRSNGDGEMSDLIKGIEYVVNDHLKNLAQNITGTEFKGSVINLSIGAGKSPALTLAIKAATKYGVHFAVAAGNEQDDACYLSPSDSEDVITVGATGFSDQMAFFSNYGPCVNIFAPGMNIMSTFIGPNNNETLSLTGTSMASPHVAGLIAYFLSLQPEIDSQYNVKKELISPEILREKVSKFATKDAIYDVPELTPNLMIFNGRGENLSKFWNY